MNNAHEYLEHDIELRDKLVKIYKNIKYDLYYLNCMSDDSIDGKEYKIIVKKYIEILDCDIDTAEKIFMKVSNYISLTGDTGEQYVL